MLLELCLTLDEEARDPKPRGTVTSDQEDERLLTGSPSDFGSQEDVNTSKKFQQDGEV